MVLEKIHDYMAEMFKAMGDITKAQEEKLNVEITKVKLKKEDLYKTEIKRLKGKDEEAMREMDYLEKKNNELIRLLTEYGKNNVVDKLLVQGVMRGYNGMERSVRKESGLR
jgi:hypothetical protein